MMDFGFLLNAYFLSTIFFDIKEDTIESVNKQGFAALTIINPFESISASDVFLKNESLRKISYRYSASCGIALRNITAEEN